MAIAKGSTCLQAHWTNGEAPIGIFLLRLKYTHRHEGLTETPTPGKIQNGLRLGDWLRNKTNPKGA